MQKNAIRLLSAALLLAVALYCIFGFLATMEPDVGNVVAWRAMYAIVGVGAFVAAARLAWQTAALLRMK